MIPEDIIVEYRDRDLKRQGQIVNRHLKCKFQPVYNGVGSWSVELPSEHPAVAYLRTPGAGIIITDSVSGEVLISGPTSVPSNKATSEDPMGTATISGISDEQILWDALAYPSPGSLASAQTADYDVRTASAGALLYGFVSDNIGPTAPAARRGAFAQKLTMAPIADVGPTLTKSVRFDNLGDLLVSIATVSSLRFQVVQQGDVLAFITSEIRDRRGFIRLDVQNGTLSEQSIVEGPPTVTDVIVAGQGEGVDRTFVERTNDEASAARNDWGRRIESFKDERNTNDPLELQAAGDEVLLDGGAAVFSVKAVPSNDLSMVYPRDWTLGDIVAVATQSKESYAQVTQAAFILDDTGVYVGAALGDVTQYNENSAIQSDLTDLSQRVASLETNTTLGTTTGGDSGDSEGGSFTFVQNTPSTHWVITHNLPYNPAVSVVSLDDKLRRTDVSYPTPTTVYIDSAIAFAGKAYLS